MIWTLRIDVPTPSQNTRDGQHWAMRRRVKADWFMLIRAASTFLSIPKAKGKRRLTIERHHRAGHHQDEANIHGGCKGIVDCLVLWQLLVDDAPEWIEHGTPKQIPLVKGEKAYTVLTIEDIAA
jgi:hypothetical protein